MPMPDRPGVSMGRLWIAFYRSNETLHPGGRSSIGLARFCQPSPPGRLGCRRRDKTRGAGFLGQQRICCNGLVPNQLPKEAHLAYRCSEQRKWIQNCAARRLEDLESSGIQSKLRAFKTSPTTKLWEFPQTSIDFCVSLRAVCNVLPRP